MTLDEAINRLQILRAEHGGDMPLCIEKESMELDHPRFGGGCRPGSAAVVMRPLTKRINNPKELEMPKDTTEASDSVVIDQPFVQPPIDDRRVKVVQLDSRLLVDFLNCWRDPPAWLALPITDEIPEDSIVVSVNANWESRTVDVMIKSESFPVLQAGCRPVVIPGLVCEWREVPLLEHAKQVG